MTDIYVQTRAVEPVVVAEQLSNPTRSNAPQSPGEWMLRKMRHIDSFIVQSINRLPSRSRPSSGVNSHHVRQSPGQLLPSPSRQSSMIRVMRHEISRHLSSHHRLASQNADDQSNVFSNGISIGNSRSNANSSYVTGTIGNGQTRHILRAELRALSSISLDNPIHQGYLLSYCMLEYNAENIQFIMDVDRLQDLMSKQLPPVWNTKHWKEIDTDVNVLERKGCDVGDRDYRLSLEKVSAILLSSSTLMRRENDVTTAQDTPPTEGTESEDTGSNDHTQRKKNQTNGDNNVIQTVSNPAQSSPPRQQPQPQQPPEQEQPPQQLIIIEASSIPIPACGSCPSPIAVKLISHEDHNHNHNHNHTNLSPNKLSLGSGSGSPEKRLPNTRWKSAWPQRHITKDAIDREINRIWKTYMDFDAPRQVCVSPLCMDRTRMRAKYFTLYGPHIFSEALLDPTKTIRRDILRRFIKSDEYMKMCDFLTRCEILPPKSTLEVPPPYRLIYTMADMDILPTKKFSCRELVSDRLLYHQFYTYLRLRDAHDSLLGVRMLTIFEERITVKDWEHAEQVAWEIYRYFVAHGSCFEMKIEQLERKEILRSLAKPRVNMFDPIKRMICEDLKAQYEIYRKTDAYAGLNTIVIESLKQKQQLIIVKRNSCDAFSCYPTDRGAY